MTFSAKFCAACGYARAVLLLTVSMLAPCSSLQADDPTIKYDVSQISSSIGGVCVYVPDRWGMLHLNLVNAQDRETEVLCATAFDDEASLQYGRRLWLPPRSHLKTWHLVKLPRPAGDIPARVPYRTSVIKAGGGSEALIRDDSGKMQLSSYLHLSRPGAVIGMIGPVQTDEAASVRDRETHHLVAAAHSFDTEPPKMTELSDPALPLLPESLQSVDQLVIMDGHLRDDDMAISAIRRWLYGGGRLWVLLEQVDPRFMELLLGDEWSCQVIDHVGLNAIRLRSAGPHVPKVDIPTEFEEPVDLVRTIVGEAEVWYEVDGWPAAFWKKCGSGGLLVTTLGPRGWLRLPTDQERMRSRSNLQPSNPFVANGAALNLTADFFLPRPADVSLATALEPQMRDYVGYSIPSREVVVGLLGGFGVLLLTGAVWSWRVAKLERFGLVGTLLATAFSAVLLSIGRQHRSAVPPTLSQVQVIQRIPGTDDSLIHGSAGLFMDDSGTAQLEGSGGGWLIPDMAGSSGTIRRLVWTDLDHWRWENLPQSAGLRSTSFAAAKQSSDRISALATFGPEGISGHLSVPGSQVAEDVVLATHEGRIAVQVDAKGDFSATGDRTLSREQYLSAGLLSDEQLRRSRTMHELLGAHSKSGFPDRPVLLFWTAPWQMGLEFGQVSRTAGSALVSVPLRFVRPRDGTEVLIPPPLLPYRGATGPDGLVSTGLYDFHKQEWIEKSGATASWIRFQIPPVLLPLEPFLARLTVRVAGPVGRLQVSGWNGEQVTQVQTWTDPVGTLSLDLTDRKILRLTDDGGLLLRIAGGDPDRPELTKVVSDQGERNLYWQIDSLTMELKARVAGAAENSKAPSEPRSGD